MLLLIAILTLVFQDFCINSLINFFEKTKRTWKMIIFFVEER